MGIFLRDEPQNQPLVSAAETVAPPVGHARSAPFSVSRSITASAERVRLNSLPQAARPFAAWQAEAWVGYSRVGEIHYGFNLLANLLTRARIYAAVVADTTEAPIHTSEAVEQKLLTKQQSDELDEAVSDLMRVDFPGLVRSFVLNMLVPGECYLLELPMGIDVGEPGGPEKVWVIRSTSEVQVRADTLVMTPMAASGGGMIILPKDTYIARIWQQNPRYSKEPDSSMVAIADAIEELLMLQRLTRSVTRSRLNAGMLFVPDGITAGLSAGHTPEPSTPVPPDADPMATLAAQAVSDPSGDFLSELTDSMVTPVSDEGSASAVVPMLVTGPGDLGMQIRHITFVRGSDDWLVKRQENALQRIVQGLSFPKELVMGLEKVKFSNAVVLDEGMYKSNVEPLAVVFVDSMTKVYLKPQLLAKGWSEEDLRKITIWYDPSDIVTRPNSADQATEGLDRFMLSPTAWRREHGFSEADAPSEDDIAALLLTKMGNLPPQAAHQLLQKALGSALKLEDPVSALPPELANNAANAAEGIAPKAKDGAKPDTGGSVVKFPGGQSKQPAADPQRTAVKQVGN